MRPETLIVKILIASSILSATMNNASLANGPVAGEWQPDVRLSRNGSASRTSINFARGLASDFRGRVHVTWIDERFGPPAVFYKRSIDGGRSWGPPVQLSETGAVAENPSIAARGDAVHVVWWDSRAVVPQVFAKHSSDGGLTWSIDRAVTQSPAASAHPSLAISDSTLHLVFVDEREGSSEVYYARSIDGGENWSSEVRLSEPVHNSYTPTVAAWENHVYVAWTDTRHGGAPSSLEEEYVRVSNDGGLSFGPEIRLTSTLSNSWAPTLTAFDRQAWIVWFDDVNGNWDLYISSSDDAGATWAPPMPLTSDGPNSVRPSLSRFGESLFISYWDDRHGNDEIYLLRSDDLGASWSAPRRLTESAGASTLASSAAGPEGVHVMWQDTRDQNPEVYYKRLPWHVVRSENGRIAFSRDVAGLPQIFTALPDGSDERLLTFGAANTYPTWSRDGSALLFSSQRSGADELWTMNFDGSAPRQVTAGAPGGSFVPDWAFDGARIAYAYADPSVGHPEVWTRNYDGSAATRLTATPVNPEGNTWSLHPSWCPDGERIYYASTRSGSTQIWGMLSDGSGQEQKTQGVAPGFPDANVPEFSRDGSSIVLWAGFEQQYGDVWTMSPDGGDRRRRTYTSAPLNADNPTWSPDGRRFLFDSNADGTGIHLFVGGVGAEEPKRLLLDASGQSSWQPTLPQGVRLHLSKEPVSGSVRLSWFGDALRYNVRRSTSPEFVDASDVASGTPEPTVADPVLGDPRSFFYLVEGEAP